MNIIENTNHEETQKDATYQGLLGSLSNIAISTAAGYMVRGALGGIFTAAITTFDEGLIYYNYADKHYLTSTTIWSALTIKSDIHKLLGLTWVHDIIYQGGCVLSSTIIATYAKDMISFNMQVETGLKSFYSLYTLFSSPLDKSLTSTQMDLEKTNDGNNSIKFTLTNLLNNTFVTNFAIGFTVNTAFSVGSIYMLSKIHKYLAHLQGEYSEIAFYREQDLANGNHMFLNNMIKGAFKIVPLLGYYYGASFITHFIQSILRQSTTTELKSRITNKLFSSENGIKLTNTEEGRLVQKNVYSDYGEIIEASEIFKELISTITPGLYGLQKLYSISPDLLLFYLAYTTTTQYIPDYLTNKLASFNSEIAQLETEKDRLFSINIENIRTLTERDGALFIHNKLTILEEKITYLTSSLKLYTALEAIYYSIKNTADTVVDFILLGYKIYSNTIQPDDRFNIEHQVSEATSILMFSTSFMKSHKNLLLSLNRVAEFEKSIYEKDIVNLKYTYNYNNTLILDKVDLHINSDRLVYIENLELELGKYYAFTGKSGCGKSSILSKIKGIQHNGIDAEGTISYPLIDSKKPNIIMVTQQDYIPINSTLAEILYFPKILPNNSTEKSALISKMIAMLELTAIDRYSKSETHNASESIISNLEANDYEWYKILSGGQKKKVSIISSLLNKPDILIFDEVFNGLDKASLLAVQKLCKTTLNNTLVIVVDHHAYDNNYNNFYDLEIHFANRSLMVKNITSIEASNIPQVIYNNQNDANSSDICIPTSFDNLLSFYLQEDVIS